jgi:hypothetical protein
MKENGALVIDVVQKLKKEYCVEIRLQRTAFLMPHTTCAINVWKILRGLWEMKKTRSKIIIKTRAGGYTKIYANGKWQKKVCVINYHAECSNKDGIKVACEFDRLKTDKNGSVIYDEAKKDFAKEHIVARI